MTLVIGTTGIEQYGAAGEGRVKALIIGGPGVGKTRWSSYFPKPIYLDCEGGLASVADRKVQFVSIGTSQDMLEALNHLKFECRRPSRDRDFNTVVIDTLDAFQRKVKDEWLQAHPSESAFRGFDAWGYLDTKMQMLLTRLLNLDMNVIVAAHYTEKTIKEGDGNNVTERQEFQLQLSGAVKDQVFNDFDLVGWMGTYYELDKETNTRAQKRGLTFKPTFDKPFLKDRLHVTPPWMEVTFSDDDYAQLFAAVISRLDELPASGVFGDIKGEDPEAFAPAGGVLAPLAGGALPAQDPRDIPLPQLDKPTLMKMARDAGLEVKGNTLKGELVAMLEQKRAEDKAAASAAPAVDPDNLPPNTSDAGPASPPADLVKSTLEGHAGAASTPAEPAPAAAEPAPAAAALVEAAPAPVQAAPVQAAPVEAPVASAPAATLVEAPEGVVDTATGEMVTPPTEAEAVETVLEKLGGTVVEPEPQAAPAPEPVAAAEPAAASPVAPANDGDDCGGRCMQGSTAGVQSPGEDVEDRCPNPIGPNPDFIQLSYIKYRKHLCNDHFKYRKNL